ncbi:HAD family phosphatase [Peribacillus cavernae]|uniref:HAD family phosphatase n=1 Tax=Peribacillus cavernae TaxID=1674310 RepID=A0A433HTB4_9BACI|nr:Cof subfamily protein (haloacid dehalogenase superfamily) [Peribacillus cavernae]RUQ31569.1 HAD family phosphatase [Peribacillus cavernae]
MVQYIVSDMDGTLLNKDQKVSKENKEAIERAQNQGVEVIIATGRSFQEARFALDEANLECPVICVNGAVVYTKDGALAASNPMDPDTVKSVIQYLENEGIYFEIYTNDGTYTKNYEKSLATLVDILLTANPDLDPLKVTEQARQRVTVSHIKSIEDYEKLLSISEIEYYKFLIFSNDLQKLGDTASALKENNHLAVSSSGRENLEITSRDAQKGIALEKYVKERGGSLTEAMAIGDNFNDVSMLERVGRSVAMGNAPTKIKNICEFITDTNDENGVANAINKVLKG